MPTDINRSLFDPLAFQSRGMEVSDRYVLYINITGDGTTNYSTGANLFQKNEHVTVVAEPNENYIFNGWVEFPDSTSNTITILMDQDVTLTAVFSPIAYLNTIYQGFGTRIGYPDGTYASGTVVVLTGIPADGWEFSLWDINGYKSRRNPHIFELTDNTDLLVLFDKKVFNIKYITNGLGSISGNRSSVEYGDVLTLEAIPETGWEFSSWLYDLSDSSSENPVSILVHSDLIVGAEFIKTEYILNVSASGAGTVSLTPEKDSYVLGEDVLIQAIPNSGHSFSGWSGNLVGTSTVMRIRVCRDMNIVATFE